MRIDGLHEKEIFDHEFPFRFLINQNVNFSYSAHWHNAIELIYVLKNNFTVFVNSKRYTLHQGDILYIPSGDIHEFYSEPPTGIRIFINFELTALNPCGEAEYVQTLLRDTWLLPVGSDLNLKVKSQIQAILEESKKQESEQRLFYTARMLDVLVLLCRSMPSRLNIGSRNNSIGRKMGLEKIENSFQYIEKNYTEDIHLGDIAKATGFSEYYFSRLFKEITEKSFSRYLAEYRIKKAETLLMNPDYTISEAAYAVGFSSIATFDRQFRQIKGCSPQKFRKLRVSS